jgi:hypothetical protein
MSDFAGNAQTNPTTQLKLSALELDQRQHDPSDIDLLYRVYANKRIDAQVNFYQSRIKENAKNADFTFGAGAFVMTVSSLVATISASVRDPFWTPTLTVLSAILPAFAAMLAAFRQLYGWERQINIYRDALLGLEKVRLLAPDNDRVAASSLTDVYPDLVTQSETVFNGEVSQWGQFVVEKEGPPAKGDSVMQQLFGDLNLTDEQRATIQTILMAGKTTDVNIQTNIAKSSEVVVKTELPAGTGSDGQGGTVTTTFHSESAASVESQSTDQPGTESEVTIEESTTASVDLPPDVQPEDENDTAVG